ncbi:hypothetical protein HYQ46_006636 [Verticillium longisporum]|nr:hypothetical protein HYQ46_006636 [Verticillium longisporum]
MAKSKTARATSDVPEPVPAGGGGLPFPWKVHRADRLPLSVRATAVALTVYFMKQLSILRDSSSAAVSPRHFPFAPFDRLTPRRPCVATPHPCLVCLKDMNITQRQWQAGQRCLPRRPRHRAPRLRPTMAKDKDIEAGDAPSYVTRHTQVSLRWHAWGSHEV